MPISWKFVLILLLARSREEWVDREKLYFAQINVLLEQLGGKPKRLLILSAPYSPLSLNLLAVSGII